ncbi:MAG: Tn3 family transposase [Steroidobacteraceae bacterium]
MKTASDLEPWTLSPAERELIATKNVANRFDTALLLKAYQSTGRFPASTADVDPEAIAHLMRQLKVDATTIGTVQGRTLERVRADIRAYCKVREATVKDADDLTTWLCDHAVANSRNPDALTAVLETECRRRGIEPPALDRIDRMIHAAVHAYEERFMASIVARLSPHTRAGLDALVQPVAEDEPATEEPVAQAPINVLRADPGRPSLNSLLDEMRKLSIVRDLKLPPDLFDGVPSHELELYRQRVSVEAPYELRRHADPIRLTLLAAFSYIRGRALTDSLVELLIETVHRISARAERRVERELLEDLKRVTGKQNLLFQLADAALAHPDGVVKDVVYPIVSEATLRALVKEWKATGPTYRMTLRTFIRNSYRSHYRQMIPPLLSTLDFCSNNAAYRPVIQALALVTRYAESKSHSFPAGEDIPLDFVQGLWRDAVVEQDAEGRTRVNRITYEICVLEALREQLRCKEIWVVGADRYRNPEEDVPADFETEREAYYAALKLPPDAGDFIAGLRQEMHAALSTLNDSMPRNAAVAITDKSGGWITLTPLDPQPEPDNLVSLKSEMGVTWPMTSLLDMVKETDLRLNFTDALRSVTAHENLPRDVLRPRLLLCLHGIGTNTGLQRMNAAAHGATYKDLAYVRRRYVTVDQLRKAIGVVTNGTLHARAPLIWGDGTTACASDSKHFGAWDQNLTTQWHLRYGGPGIMIYWHVERKSLCIHSQLKSPASSEVASMIEGVLRHCTEMSVERQYVDTHGQSEVAFAFCRLLGFELLPRLKAIHSQRLYRPDASAKNAFPHLEKVLSRVINWELIGQQYDQMIKYATALRVGTAQPEAILRRFTRDNLQHPTYKALAELGKAIKTLFLCRYLHSEALRREIHEGLNIIEQWNGANDFVFFAKRGELASNRREDQEISMLCLHLLQNCMVYINTLMMQQVLTRPHWNGRLTAEDRRAITPLIWENVNPYGRFELDMATRIALN